MEFLGVLAGSHLADTSMSRMTKTNGYPKKRVWVHPHKTLTDTSTAIRALYFLALQIRDSLTKVQKFTGIESPSLLPSWLRPPGWVCHSEPEWHWATKPQLQAEACPASQSHESSCTRSILGLLRPKHIGSLFRGNSDGPFCKSVSHLSLDHWVRIVLVEGSWWTHQLVGWRWPHELDECDRWTILNNLVRQVLPNVDVFRTFTFADIIVTPVDIRIQVVHHRYWMFVLVCIRPPI